VTQIVAIGGSDAGISAALRARELDPGCDFTVVVADAYPNFSICGIPYYVSGEVTHWRNLAHRIASIGGTAFRDSQNWQGWGGGGAGGRPPPPPGGTRCVDCGGSVTAR
jgi:hypothetical protein